MIAIRVTYDAGANRAIAWPEYETVGAAGADLWANLPDRGQLRLQPGARAGADGFAYRDTARLRSANPAPFGVGVEAWGNAGQCAGHHRQRHL